MKLSDIPKTPKKLDKTKIPELLQEVNTLIDDISDQIESLLDKGVSPVSQIKERQNLLAIRDRLLTWS